MSDSSYLASKVVNSHAHVEHGERINRSEERVHGHRHSEHGQGESTLSLLHLTPKHKSHEGEMEARRKRERATSETLHTVHFSDIAQEKRVLIDKNQPLHDRLRAAHELLSSHIAEVQFTDGAGSQRKLEINQSSVDGRLRVIEGERVIMEDTEGRSFTDHLKAPRRPLGIDYAAEHFRGVGTYRQPSGGQEIEAPPVASYYKAVQNPDGSKTINFKGCAVDTDGAGYHPEDKHWRSQTGLKLSNGQSLNTDLDNFVVLSPSLAASCGVKLGDCGYLVDKSTGRAVPVVFGDTGHEGRRSAEASVHALKQLGRHEKVDGNNGLEGQFQVVVVPHTGDGTGDLARNPDRIKNLLDARAGNGPLIVSG